MSTDLPADPNRHAVTPEPLETGAAASSHTATPQSAPTAPYPGQAEGPTQALPHTGQAVVPADHAQQTHYPQPAPGYGQTAPAYNGAIPPTITVHANVQAPAIAAVDKSVGAAYVLLFFVGVFGGHHFYLGKIGRGVSYLFTAGWLTIGLWIDLSTLPAQVKQINTQRRMGIR